MKLIVLESARYHGDKGFEYRIEERFPCNARGLALAVLAFRNLTKADAHHRKSDFAIKAGLKGSETWGHCIPDDTLFEFLFLAGNDEGDLYRSCKNYITEHRLNESDKAAA